MRNSPGPDKTQSRVIGGTSSLLAALGVLILATASPAAAHFSAGAFSYDDSRCTTISDPVGIIWYGNATGANVDTHVAHHGGLGAWSIDAAVGQYYLSHGACGGTSHAKADAYDTNLVSRFHVRIRKTYDTDPTWGITSQSTPHHEDFILFGLCHAVDKGGINLGGGLQSGFDYGRNTLVSVMTAQGGHVFGGWTNWGNTFEKKQCDGDYAGSHGNVGWVKI